MADDPSLSAGWEAAAHDWAKWARAPGNDSYWRFHREPFLSLLPRPGRLTIDIGCGDGRVARDLKALGHNVVAVDVSPTMVEYAKAADPSMKVLVADAARLPFDDSAADLAVAFMSLHDVEDMPGAIREAGRVDTSYLESHRYHDSIERAGLRMTINSRHWPLEAYFRAL